MQEIWKDIKNYEGIYQVSNLGRIKSFPRNGTQINTIKILKPKINRKYYCVTLSKNNKRICKSIHRLVAEAFILNPENKPQVNHKDGNKLNNYVNNLEWVTNQENITHSIITGLKPNDHGVNSCNSKMTKEQVFLCRKIYKPKDKQFGCCALAKMFNVSKSTMSYILNNKTYM